MAQVLKSCTKILYNLSVQHAEALDHPTLLSFFHDVHGALSPLLSSTQLLLSPSSSSSSSSPLLPPLAKITKHLATLLVDVQKKTPLVLRGGALSPFLHLFADHLAAATGE